MKYFIKSIPIILLLLTGLFIYLSISKTIVVIKTKGYPTVEATVTYYKERVVETTETKEDANGNRYEEENNTKYYDYEYKYTVSGKEYKKSKKNGQYYEFYKINEIEVDESGDNIYGYINVQYNPDHPEIGYLKEETKIPYVFYILTVFFAVVSFFAIRNVYSKK